MIVPKDSSSTLLRYDTVVRLTQYVALSAAGGPWQSFVSAWKDAFGVS